VHVPIVGVALIPVVLGGPVLLLPLHVVLLELLIDPACSLVFEAEPAPDDSMDVPPRRKEDTLFSLASAARALALGGLAFAGVALVQWVCRERGASPEVLRLANLGSIVLGNLLLLMWFRRAGFGRRHANAVFHALLVGVCVVWVLLTGVPGVGAWFGLATLPPHWALWVALPGSWAAWRLVVHSRFR